MYFLSCGSKFSAWVVGVKLRYLYAITIFAILAITVIWLFTFYFRVNSSIGSQRNAIKVSQQQLMDMKQIQASRAQLVSEINEMQVALQEYAGSQELQLAIVFLINQAHQFGLIMQSCAIDQQDQKDWYTQSRVGIHISGPYNKLLKFFKAIADSDHVISIDRFHMAKSTQNSFNVKSSLVIASVESQ